MKKIVVCELAVLTLMSCGISKEDKANDLIVEDVKKTLYHPESYEAVETVIDSAFAPMDDPAFYEKSLEMCQLAVKAQLNTDRMQKAEQKMNLWKSPYKKGIDKTNYEEARLEYDDCSKNAEILVSRMEKGGGELMEMAKQGYRFIGYKASHRFRAKNGNDQAVLCDYIYIMNEDLTKILDVHDTDSKEYQMVQAMYRMFQEEALN